MSEQEQTQEKHIPFGCWVLGSILLVVIALLIIVVFINFFGAFAMLFQNEY